MLLVTPAMFWLVLHFEWYPQVTMPVTVITESRRPLLPPYMMDALWAGLYGAVAAVLSGWLTGRLAFVLRLAVFAAVFLAFQRIRGPHSPSIDQELTLLFAAAWAVGTASIDWAIRLVTKRAMRRQ
jgi:hypothetical protein